MYVEKAFSRCTTGHCIFVFCCCFFIVHSASLPCLAYRGRFLENRGKRWGGLEFLVKMRVIYRKVIYRKGGAPFFVCNVWVLQQWCFLLTMFIFLLTLFDIFRLLLFRVNFSLFLSVAYGSVTCKKKHVTLFCSFLNKRKLLFLVHLFFSLSHNLLGQYC